MNQNNFSFFEEKEVIFEFNKRFSKKTDTFFNFLIEHIQKKKSTFIRVEVDFLLDILKFYDRETLLDFLSKFMERKLKYKILYSKELDSTGELFIISDFKLHTNLLEINISKAFFSIFEKDSFFQENHFNIFIFLKHQYAIPLYNVIKYNISLNQLLEISLINLKGSIGIESGYSRFYDFERAVLKPCLKEISSAMGKKIKYRKKKKVLANNKKIDILHFYLDDLSSQRNLTLATTFIELFDDKLEEFQRDNALKLLLFWLDKRGDEYTKTNVNYSIDHYKGNFFKFLDSSLKFDYYNSKYLKRIEKYQFNNEILFQEEKIINSIAELQADIFKVLTTLKIYYLTLNPNFLRALQDLNKQNELTFIGQDIIIIVEYSQHNLSRISFFKG